MKLSIEELPDLAETEIIIRCRQADDEILGMLATLRAFDQKITGEKNGQTFLLEAGEILYFDTVDKRTFLYTEKDVYETPLRLYELEERLKSRDFFRASKSAVVNFNAIRSLRPDFGGRMELTMSNGEKLFISRQYVPTIKQKLGI